jgi:hypothetical protein
MNKKIWLVLGASVLIASGFQVQKQEAHHLNFININEVVPFTLQGFDVNDNELKTENFLIDKYSKARTDVKLAEVNFSSIHASPGGMQYYNDRLIMNSHDGKSIELIKESTGDLKVNQYNFEIVLYDEAQKKYMTRPTVSGTKKGLYILDEKMSQERFIPLPAVERAFMPGGSLQAYSLDTIIYVGDADEEKFKVKKYDMTTGQWDDLAALLPPHVYEGYEGNVNMSYSVSHPDWLAVHIDKLYNKDYMKQERMYDLVAAEAQGLKYSEHDEKVSSAFEREAQARAVAAVAEGSLKQIEQVYFVNIHTGEIRVQGMPIQLDRPIFHQTSTGVGIGQSKDNIFLLDMNPFGIRVLEELPIAQMFPPETASMWRKINHVIAYDGTDLLFNTTGGIVMYNNATKQSEYVVDLRGIK